MKRKRIVVLFSAVAALLAPPLVSANEKQDKTPASKPALPRFKLDQLLSKARATYPGIRAVRHEVDAMETQLFRARWAWIPQGRVKMMLGPAPELNCQPLPIYEKGKPATEGSEIGYAASNRCLVTNIEEFNLNALNIAGVFFRFETELGMPLYTFNKIRSARKAAEAGVRATKARLASKVDHVMHDVQRAYWGVKLARELIYYVEDGTTYLTKGRKMVEEKLDKGEGDYTLEDLMRLKVAETEVAARLLDAHKLERVALASLAALTGMKYGTFDVDDKILEVLPGKPGELHRYRELQLKHRPDIRAINFGIEAAEQGKNHQLAKFLPDLVLGANFIYSVAKTVASAPNAFFNDPANQLGVGFALTLNWNLDQLQQYGSYAEAEANLSRAEAQRAEALRGLDLELQHVLVDLRAAQKRMQLAKKATKTARSWLVAVSQNMEAGTAQPRDLVDSLVGYFTHKLRYLQSVYEINVGWSNLARVVGTRVRLMTGQAQ